MALNIIIEGQANLGVTTGIPASINVEMGVPGASATVNVGTTTTGNPGTNAAVTNSGTESAAIFNFTIPRGDKGEQGNAGTPGTPGTPGTAATINVGTTTTGSAGSSASVTNSGSTSAAVFNFTIPRGDTGQAGSPGQGVATGGTVGQVLAKVDSSNYSTQWVNQSVAWGNITGGIASQTDLNDALVDKLSLSGGIMSGAIVFDPIGGQNINRGTFDSGRGGYNGISLNCAVGVELNWQAGFLKAVNSGGFNVPVNFDSNIALSDDVFGSGNSKTISANAIDNESYSGFILANGGDASGAFLKVNFGNTGEGYENQAILTQSSLTFKEAIVGTTFASYGQGGITFSDGSTQGTAALPLTGGNLNGNLYIEYNDVSLELTPNGLSCGGDTAGWILNGDNGLGFTDYEYTRYKGDKIIFNDQTEQTTAFPGYTGTTSDYIDGTGQNIVFPPVGDRYTTTSTTSLTISNGTKTLTIGTGLSYTSQQEINIAYDASHHMHATVTSYNPTTGVMVADVHKKTGSGTYASWTVNLSGAAGGSYLAIENNLSELTDTASTARTNLGLGTMATATATDYLSKAGNLSGLASTATSRSNLGLGAVATDAYATTAQAQAGTSTTTVINPSTLLDSKYFQGGVVMNTILWSTATSGTGASAGQQNGNGRLNTAPTTATGYSVASAPIVSPSRGLGYTGGYDFSKRIIFGARIARNVASPDANSVWRLSIGKNQVTATIGDLTVRGLMIKVAGSGALQLLVHNGTALTTITSSFTPSNTSAYDVNIVSDGAGNVTLYVNGSSVATSTGGPTTSGGGSQNGLHFECENIAIISASPQNICISNTFVQVNV